MSSGWRTSGVRAGEQNLPWLIQKEANENGIFIQTQRVRIPAPVSEEKLRPVYLSQIPGGGYLDDGICELCGRSRVSPAEPLPGTEEGYHGGVVSKQGWWVQPARYRKSHGRDDYGGRADGRRAARLMTACSESDGDVFCYGRINRKIPWTRGGFRRKGEPTNK